MTDAPDGRVKYDILNLATDKVVATVSSRYAAKKLCNILTHNTGEKHVFNPKPTAKTAT